MLTFEFHGFDTISPQLHARIKELFKDRPYYSKIVIAYQGSYAAKLSDYQKVPLIRVYGTTKLLNDYGEDIRRRLRSLGYVVQEVALHAHWPAIRQVEQCLDDPAVRHPLPIADEAKAFRLDE